MNDIDAIRQTLENLRAACPISEAQADIADALKALGRIQSRPDHAWNTALERALQIVQGDSTYAIEARCAIRGLMRKPDAK